jgi:hypothetical protein
MLCRSRHHVLPQLVLGGSLGDVDSDDDDDDIDDDLLENLWSD